MSNNICWKNNANHHHLDVCDLQVVDLYIIRINVFGAWKILAKKFYSKTGKLMQISTLSRWRRFKRHTVNIKDELLRTQLSKLVEAVSARSDPFAADLMYHFPCWRDYISNLHFDPKKTVHLQNATYSEIKQMFFRKVDQIIFAEHKIQSFQSVSYEYRKIAREYDLSWVSWNLMWRGVN